MRRLAVYGALMVLLILAAWWIRTVPLDLPWHRTGLVSASLGCVLLASYALARLLQLAKLPLISGYIFFGIMAGPFVSGFMDREMVARFRLIDELALSFIAMTAGGELRLDALRERGRTIAANIVFQGVLVFAATMAVMLLAGRWFGPLAAFPPEVRISVSLLLSVVALSLSPSAVIALIGECRASGRFTDTILSVTLAMDVLIILLFTVTISGARLILSPEAAGFSAFFWLLLETLLSLVLGVGFGCLVAAYIRHIGRDVIMFLFAAAFGMSRFCAALGDMATSLWGIHLVPEPILLCMVAGFVVRNFSAPERRFWAGSNGFPCRFICCSSPWPARPWISRPSSPAGPWPWRFAPRGCFPSACPATEPASSPAIRRCIAVMRGWPTCPRPVFPLVWPNWPNGNCRPPGTTSSPWCWPWSR